MDREAVVIRAEMTHTRAELDRKLSLLEGRARELSPKVVAQRYMPEYLLDRAIGAVLTVVGAVLAVRHFTRKTRQERMAEGMVAYGRW